MHLSRFILNMLSNENSIAKLVIKLLAATPEDQVSTLALALIS